MLKTDRPSADEVRRKIFELVHVGMRPLLIGRVAMHLGWWATLAETEAYLEGLVAEGLLRHLTAKEARDYSLMHGYVGVDSVRLAG